MKKLLAAVILTAMAGGVFAADFSDLQAFKAADATIMAPVVSNAGVSEGTGDPALLQRNGKSGDDAYNGKIRFIDWGLIGGDSFKPRGGLVVTGVVAKTIYDTMINAAYRPAPANFATLKPSQISRGICEARIGKQMACIKIPLFSADSASLVLADGKPVYNDDSYQCDISIPDVTTMDFGVMRRPEQTKGESCDNMTDSSWIFKCKFNGGCSVVTQPIQRYLCYHGTLPPF